MSAETSSWKRCSSCKAPIAFEAGYWACNVSTCNRGRTALFFCSVSCWDAHLAVVNHRESWAVERKAPTRAEWEREQAAQAAGAAPLTAGQAAKTESAPRRILPAPAARPSDSIEREILIVASKLKAYVRARCGYNTSDRALEPLSDAVRALCDRAIEKARAEGRRTVLDRDFE
jgi:hypothetical protein